MNNGELADKLDEMLTALKARSTELHDRWLNPDGPLDERQDRRDAINLQKGVIDHSITHIELQRDNYRAAIQIEVAPLTDTQRDALEAAIQAVSSSIAATQDFQNFLQLATQVAQAANAAEPIAG